MTKVLVATGIFMWEGLERRSDRYGRFYACSSTLNGNVEVQPTFEVEAAEALNGKRVRITVEVVSARESGHVGDMFHGISPMKPKKGDVIDLGVGIFDVGRNYNNDPDIGLRPNDGRSAWWINPNQLYKLHDQTVNVFVEETQDEFTPSAFPGAVSEDEAISNGDGSFQTKGDAMNMTILPQMERLGEGLFAFTTPGMGSPKGEIFPVKKTS